MIDLPSPSRSTSAQASAKAAAPGAITPAELAELMGAFNQVTARLEATHDQLRAEVARLTGELKAAGEQLERSRRLSALGEMAAGIAHEVRNPLGSIRLYARLLDQDLADRPSERTTVAKIAAAAKHLDGIVGDVLTFSREFRIRRESVDAATLVERALEGCRHDGVPGVSAIRVESDLPPIDLFVDPSLFIQALVNVIRNAFEAMAEHRPPHSGHVLTISCERRMVTQPKAGRRRMVTIRIADTGPGVPQDVRARMFNPFFTTRSAGTGLGLAIVHRIIDAHEGRIVVQNRQDSDSTNGAIFDLMVPCAVARPDGGPSARDRASVVVVPAKAGEVAR